MDGWMKGYINKKMLEMPFKNRILIHYDPFPSPMDLFRSIHSPTVNKKLFLQSLENQVRVYSQATCTIVLHCIIAPTRFLTMQR